MDSECVEAALLHDVVEDTDVTAEQVQKQFGADVALLVEGVTKLGKISFTSREEQQAENVRKMLLAMAQDVRVIIIKLADRLHNMRTIEVMPEQKRRDKALETDGGLCTAGAQAWYPRGQGGARGHLPALPRPGGLPRDRKMLELKMADRQSFLENDQGEDPRAARVGIQRGLHRRAGQSVYGIYRKVYIQGRAFEEIFDIYAVRIIVDSVNECYNILGIIHDLFRPLPNRFKDYISTPKPNMYQSLHTTVIDKEGIPFEVQIRTWEMHHTAEYGIAAHWKYKLGMTSGNEKPDSLEARLQWIRNMLDNQSESEDVTDLVRSIKTDLAPEEVFVFTPKGDVINLPMGSTVIDFAYAIHSAVGNRMIGAKVDQRIVPLDYKVKTGEIIEILTTKEVGRGPNRDWLSLVRTSEARNKIRTWFKKEKREENIVEGKAELEREFKRNNIVMSDELMQFMLDSAGRRHSCSTPDDFYAAIGYGGIQLWKIMPRVKEEYQKYQKPVDKQADIQQQAPQTANKKAAGGVLVEGMDNCLIKFSRCCNPLPGDEIIGFITRGFGVSIHKRSCSNVPKDFTTCPEPERWVRAHWAGDVKEEFKSTLHIVSTDRSGLLADVTQQLFNMHIFIHSLNSREIKNTENALISATISINGMAHLQQVIDRLSKIRGVISIDRS